jgi:hypothetical protein
MESFIEFVLFIAVAIAFYRVVALAIETYQAYKVLKNFDKKFEEELVKKLEEAKIKVIEVNIEKHQDTYYLFSKENDQFIAQGKNKDEIVDAIQARYKGYRILTQQEQLDKFGLDW